MEIKQAERIVEEYINKIYGFVLNKTATLEDAEDLTQEITFKLYKALCTQEVEYVSGFVWSVVRNALANYYRGKSRHGKGICIEDIEKTLTTNEDLSEKLIEQEGLKQLHDRIAYLSKVQRKAVIMYYYEGKKQEEIAKALDISISAVKWHLFEARSEMKKGMETVRNVKELRFNPIKFDKVALSGSSGKDGRVEDFFRSALAQNIAYCILWEAKTVNEIADCLGVSPVYVESEVEILEEYELLVRQGKRYLTNILIDELTSELNQLRNTMYEESAKIFVNELYDELINSELLKEEGLWYPENDINFLMWSLIPYISTRTMSEQQILEEGEILFEEAATLRPDGGHNIVLAIMMNKEGTQLKYYEDMEAWSGVCWNMRDGCMLWQIDSEWSTKRIDEGYQDKAQYDLQLLRRFLYEDSSLSEYEYAYMVEKGYIKTKGNPDGMFKVINNMVCIRNEETNRKLIDIGIRIREKHKKKLQELKEPYVKAALKNTPKHLYKMKKFALQYLLYLDACFVVHCTKELVANGKLQLPSEEQKKVLMTVVVPY